MKNRNANNNQTIVSSASNKFSSFTKSDKKEQQGQMKECVKPKIKKNNDNDGFVEVGLKNKKKIKVVQTEVDDDSHQIAQVQEDELDNEPLITQNPEKCNELVQVEKKKSVSEILTNKIAELENNKNEKNDDMNGNDCYLNTQWTVWVHRNDCKDWTEASFKSIYVIDSIGSFWRFFNNFHNLNKEDNQFFIMRNKIKPIWEDNNNRNGGLCSLKMDCYDRNNRFDLGSEVMICLSLLAMNETLLPDNNEINGVSYSIRNRSVVIKIWGKDCKYNMKEKLPEKLINKFSNMIKNNVPFKKYVGEYVSIRYSEIKPEDN
jgi:hypothetical protein